MQRPSFSPRQKPWPLLSRCRQQAVCWLLFLCLGPDLSVAARAAELNPFQAGRKALEIGSNQIAVARFSEAIESRLQPFDAHVSRGLAYARMNDVPHALADFEAAARLRPHQGTPWHWRGETLAHAGDYRGARAAFVRAAQSEPAEPNFRNALAWLLATCPDAGVRDGTRAVQEGQEACRLRQWKDPFTLDTLAAAYAEAGNFEEANRWQTQAVSRLDQTGLTGSSSSHIRAHLKIIARRQPIRDKM